MQDMFYRKQRGLAIASHKILYCSFLVFKMLLICPFKNKQKETLRKKPRMVLQRFDSKLSYSNIKRLYYCSPTCSVN